MGWAFFLEVLPWHRDKFVARNRHGCVQLAKAGEALWKRIVVAIGEKIGESHLTYAQGASAEIVALVAMAGWVQHWGLFNIASTKEPQLSFNRGSFLILSLVSPGNQSSPKVLVSVLICLVWTVRAAAQVFGLRWGQRR